MKKDSEDPAFAIIIPMASNVDASNARGRVPPTPAPTTEPGGHALWCRQAIEEASTRAEQADAMQAYIQAKLGVTEAWVEIPEEESLDDGGTASKELLEARRMRRLEGSRFSDLEERRSRKMEDEEDRDPRWRRTQKVQIPYCVSWIPYGVEKR